MLVEDKDYTVKYRINKELGTAYVDVTGINNYSGTETVEFSIKSYTSQAQITCIDRVYNGKEQLIAFCSGGSISNEFQT